jgi:hypothetical protein
MKRQLQDWYSYGLSCKVYVDLNTTMHGAAGTATAARFPCHSAACVGYSTTLLASTARRTHATHLQPQPANGALLDDKWQLQIVKRFNSQLRILQHCFSCKQAKGIDAADGGRAAGKGCPRRMQQRLTLQIRGNRWLCSCLRGEAEAIPAIGCTHVAEQQ